MCVWCIWLLTKGCAHGASGFYHRDTMDSVKQSAALCLLRLYKASPDLVLMGEWTSRVVHLLNDQHMVCSRGLRHALMIYEPRRHSDCSL